MPNENDLTGKVSLDTTGFKAGVNDLNAQIRSIETGFRASAAVMDNWSGSSDGLIKRTDTLSEKLGLQKQKLTLLKNEYDKVVASQGAGSSAAASLANQMYSAEKVIQSTQNDLKKYNAELEYLGKNTKDIDTTGLKKVNAELDNIGKSSKGINLSGLKNALSGIGGAAVTGLKMAGMAIVGLGAAAVGAVTGIVKLAESASDLNEAQNVVQQTYKASSKSVIDWTNTITLSTGIGKQAATMMVGTMGAMLKSGGQTEDAARKMSMSLTQLSGDMASFYNLDSKDAFEKLRSGISGETEPLKQLGINMSVANLSAYALAEGITKSYKEMSQAEQTTLRYNYLMKVTADMQGDFTRTSGGMANQTRIMGENFNNLTTTIGANFLPAVTSMLPSLNGVLSAFTSFIATGTGADQVSKAVAAAADGIAKSANQMIPVITSMLTAIVSLLTGIIPKILPQLITIGTQVITQIITAIVSAIPQVLLALANGVVQLLNAMVAMWQANGPALIKAGIDAVMTLVTGLVTALPQIISAAIMVILALVDGLAKQLPTLIPMAINAILTIVQGLLDNLPMIIDSAIKIVLALVDGIMNALPQLIAQVPKIIISIINGIIDALPKLIDAAPKIIVAVIMGIINALPELIKAAPQIVMSIIFGVIQAIPQLLTLGPQILKGVWDGLKDQDWGKIGGDIIKGICDGFFTAVDFIKNAVAKIGDTIMGGIKSFFGINSPSKLMRDEIGLNIGAGIAEGLEASKAKLSGAIKSVSKSMNVELNAQLPTSKNGMTATGAPGASTYVFYQTNASPKALSPAETARYTRNLLRQATLTARG